MASRSDRTRAAIIEAAGRLWLERGLHGVGLEDIAAAAGVTRRTIYLHFRSKAALLLGYAERSEAIGGLPELLARLESAGTAAEMLDVMGELQFTYLPRVYDGIRLVHASRRDEPAAEEVWQDRMRGRRALHRKLARRLIESGELDPELSEEEATMLILTLTSPHMYEYLVVDGGWSMTKYRRHVVRLLKRALLRP